MTRSLQPGRGRARRLARADAAQRLRRGHGAAGARLRDLRVPRPLDRRRRALQVALGAAAARRAAARGLGRHGGGAWRSCTTTAAAGRSCSRAATTPAPTAASSCRSTARSRWLRGTSNVASEGGETVELVCRVRCDAHAVRARAPHAARARAGDPDAEGARREHLRRAAHHLVWGHHCVVGAPFLEAGCRLHAPARTIMTLPEAWEDTARLARCAARAVARCAARGWRAHRPARGPGPRGGLARRRLPDRSRATGRSPSRTRASAAPSGSASTDRCSAGCARGRPTAARARCRWRAPTRSGSSRGSRAATSSRPWRRARRSSSRAARRSRPP